jgi:uncharacterized protein
MRFVLHCILAKNSDKKRLALRPTHLRFMAANQDRIFCGGPTVDLAGQLEMMLIILDASDRESAEDFIKTEPYYQAGVFERVTIREWRQVLPEVRPGALLQEIDREAQA